MMRSLDGLVRNILDRVALCGEFGALPSDFIGYVKDYYAEASTNPQDVTTDDNIATDARISPNIDRPFLEYIWKCLTKHPEIRVGDRAAYKRLTLSEVEARNAAIERLERSKSTTPAPKHDKGSTTSRGSKSVQDHQSAQVQGLAELTRKDAIEQSTQLDTASGSPEIGEPPTAVPGSPNHPADGPQEPVKAAPINNVTATTAFQPGIRLYASEHRMWYALTGHGPDLAKVKALDFICLSIIAACGPRGILQHHLTRITGQDKRSLPGRTDRLRDGGYIVKERETIWEGTPRRVLHTSRCTLARFVKATNQINKPESIFNDDPPISKKNKNKRKNAINDSQGDPTDVTQRDSPAPATAKHPEPAPLPQWTSGRSVGNQIFDLVKQSGTQGMSLREIRENLFGAVVWKVTEDYVSRLVERWQVSQPLHLRHLAIVRDTRVSGKSQIYVHYTYENFQKLVEAGTAFWEAIKTVPENVKYGNNVAAALDAKPDVDEYGFPKLDSNQFQGRHNDATLAECVSALNAGRVHLTHNDPWLKKQADGTSVIQYKYPRRPVFGRSDEQQPKLTVAPHVQQASRNPTQTSQSERTASPRARRLEEVDGPKGFVFLTRQVQEANSPNLDNRTPGRKAVRKERQRGRPRKYPKSGVPENIHQMSPFEIKKLRDSQEMAEKYERNKIEYEINTRVEAGEDNVFVTNEVLAAADTLRKWDGMAPLPAFTRAQILHNFAGGPAPEPVGSVDGNMASLMPSSYFLLKIGSKSSRRTKKPPYRPSMAAHTLFVPRSLEQSERPKPGEGFDAPQMRTRHRRQRGPPAVTQDIVSKDKQVVARYRYLPSVAAHSGSFLPLLTLPPVKSRSMGPGSNDLSMVQDHEIATPDVSSAQRGATQIVPTLESTLDASPSVASTHPEGAYPGWVLFMSKYYFHELNVIARPHNGIFFGNKKKRRKRRNEPQGLRPPFYQVAIFKLARLRELDWFVAKPKVPDLATSPSSQGQSAKHSATGYKVLPHAPAVPADLRGSQSSALLELPPIGHVSPGPEPEPSNLLPYVTATGRKRKRADCPQRTRDSSPPGRLSGDPHRVDAAPRKMSSTASKEPTILSDVETPPADFNQANNEATMEAPVTTSISDRLSFEEIPLPRAPEARVTDGEEAELRKGTRTAEQLSITDSPTTTTVDASDRGEKSGNESMNNPSPTPKPSAARRKTREPPNKKSVARMTRLGGSVALLRRKIVMDLVEKCGGVFPSHKEMVYPFAAEWVKRGGPDSMPEVKTIQKVVNDLCAEDKLQKITFSYQNQHGMVATKSMLAFSDIEITDPRIKETQTQIVAHHPRHYIPAALLPAEDPDSPSIQLDTLSVENEGSGNRRTDLSTSQVADLKRRRWGINMLKGKNQVIEDRLTALRAQDSGNVERPDADNSTAELPNELETTAEPSSRPAKMLVVPPRPPKQYIRPQGWVPRRSLQKGKFRHLLSIEGTEARPKPPLPLPPLSSGPADDRESLTWLPSQYAFTEYNFEELRPTLVKPEATGHARRRWSRLSKTVRFSEPTKRRTQRMREIAENAARIERLQAQGKPRINSWPWPEVAGDLSQSLYTPMRPPSGTSVRRESLASGSTTVPPSSELHALHGSESVLELNIPKINNQPELRRGLLVGLMDPVHFFNRLSGTFSVTFSGIRPPLKFFGGRGTALHPYMHGIRGSNMQPRKRRRIGGIATQFEKEIDDTLNFELTTVGLQDAAFTDWPIINYRFPHSHTTVETVESDDDTARTESGRAVRKVKHARTKIDRNIFNTGARGISAAATEALKRIQLETPMKRRRLTSLMVNENKDGIPESAYSDADTRPTKIRRIRGPRLTSTLGPDGEKRLLTAVVVVRTLTGGLEKIVDWVLVAKAFEGMHDQLFIHRRWNYVLQKNKLIVPQMEEDFQNMFMKAYEDGAIPTLDFENLADYDWKWLVEWVMDNFGSSLQSRPELPVNRCDFDRLYTFDESSEINLNDYYATNGISNITKRTSALNHSAYVYPLEPKARSAQTKVKEQIAIAKTWVRANVITSEDTYDGYAARERLSMFPDSIIEDALKELLLDRVLMQENKGRLVPGRNYDINEYFLTLLKKSLLPKHFKRALAYKIQLDRDFKEQGFALYSFTADDGDVLAIMNMVAEKRITLVPVNVPANKWGQTDGSYETRLMDKRRLNFNIEIHPLATYVEGVPIAPLPPPPSHHLQEVNAKIPLWYDIHDQLVPVMWDMALAAVLALLAIRPGADANVIVQSVRPAMDVWEIEWILEWLISAKAAHKVENGYVFDEWWWLTLGGGEEALDECVSNEDPSRDLRNGKENEETNDVSLLETD